MRHFAKLICEPECAQTIKGEPSKEDIYLCFVQPVLDKLGTRVVDAIFKAQLKEDHIYRYCLQVHAQQREEE